MDALEEQVRRAKEEGVSVLIPERNEPFTANLIDRTYIIDMPMIRYEADTKHLIENKDT